MTENGKYKTALRSIAEQVIPDAATGRMARIFDVNQRSVQKWMNGQNPVPDHVVDFMNGQYASLFHHVYDGPEGEKTSPSLDDELSKLIASYIKRGVHREVMAAHLALAYKRTANREIE